MKRTVSQIRLSEFPTCSFSKESEEALPQTPHQILPKPTTTTTLTNLYPSPPFPIKNLARGSPIESTTMINSTQMEMNIQEQKKSSSNKRYIPLLIINYTCLFLGSVSSSLLAKYYFIHKGSSRWVSSWVQCAGFPLLLIPIYLPYLLHIKNNNHQERRRRPFTHFTPKIFALSILVGIMLGVNNLLISWGNSYLPISTSSLLLSSQLAFNLILSVIIVKQKVTFSNLNCVILLTLSSLLLALNHENNDNNNQSITRAKYFIGFFSTIGAGLLFALYLPVMEKIYSKVYCYEMVMEMQLVMEIAATALATVGMLFDGGFMEMKRESQRVFDKGPTVYWVTVVANIVTWQLCFMGTAGMVFLTSSLTGGICMTALMGMNVLGGVVVYRDEFGGVKAVSTVLCGWGFCSYVYGMYVKMRDEKADEQNKEIGGGGGEGEGSSMEMVRIDNHNGV